MNVLIIEQLPSVQHAIRRVVEAMPEFKKLTTVGRDAAHESVDARQNTLLIFGCSANLVEDRALLAETIQRYAPLRSLALYENPDLDFAHSAVRLGVAGYVSKAAAPIVMRASLNLLRVGGSCYPPLARTRPIGTRDAPTFMEPGGLRLTAAAPPHLTGRQTQLLGMLAAGKDARAVGKKMGVTVATVRSHANKLYHKLGARNRAEAVFNASRLGLV
ncbi:response regulator transcription factor [Pigmentiphaga litoralis]|uniref:DNA-binding NarL/FixJ family response regulator n=1 Tax=Pigmentiphaga litoralis TaxID=516702 RepID=A0A7Y9LMN7_9BURK|nr:response regulator transcription factor [Pigmentiphaga litoralis]NYE23931.1 DNA-binding NarL/FixJ family response regulator [Pigmentiphaga litoralis]NYE82455.1 DNA-binding NarL/FixJ family response regulator [Pigmentiphaga litoralis]